MNRSKQEEKTDNRPLGVFDSGLGGLTVVAAMRKLLPAEDLVYLGDTARVPYGNRSVGTICEFACQDLSFLASKGVKAVVVACNTVSAVALPEMRKQMPKMPIFGVLEAGVSAAIRTHKRRITVLGTRATINSDSYRQSIHAIDPSLVVKSIACPLFVPLAEEGEISGPIAEAVMNLYLQDLKQNPPELLMLGCTHYPLLKQALAEYLPPDVQIVDSAVAAAEFVRDHLRDNHLMANSDKTGEDRYYVTDMAGSFYEQAQRFLGWEVGHVEKVNL